MPEAFGYYITLLAYVLIDPDFLEYCNSGVNSSGGGGAGGGAGSGKKKSKRERQDEMLQRGTL